MKTVTSTEAKAKLNAILAEAERTVVSVRIINHGRPVAVLIPAHQRSRRFGQLPALAVPDTFDDSLPEAEIGAWEGNSRLGGGSKADRRFSGSRFPLRSDVIRQVDQLSQALLVDDVECVMLNIHVMAYPVHEIADFAVEGVGDVAP
jgi:prevent-host-death family protein